MDRTDFIGRAIIMIKQMTYFTLMLFMMPLAQASESYLPARDMVEQALDNYPVYQQARQNIETSRSVADSLRYGPHELTLSSTYTQRQISGLTQLDEYDASLSKGIRLFGKGRLDRKTAALEVEIAENIAEDARHQAALTLKQFWMDWIKAAEIHRINQDYVEIHRKSLAALEKRRALNNASDLDVGLAQSALQTALALQAEAEGNEKLARDILAKTFPEIILPHHAPRLPVPGEPVNMEQWLDLVVSRSHELTIVEKKAEQLGVIARRSGLDRFADPTLGVRLFNEQGGDETGIGVTISVPIGVRQRGAAAAQGRAEAKAAEYNLAYMRREIGIAAMRDVQNVLNAYKTWQMTLSAFESSQFVIEKTRRSYELGGHDYAQLLLAEQQFLASKKAEVDARHNVHNAWLQLKIDAHELWLENVH